MADVVGELQKLEDECDCDWWCWIAGMALMALGVATFVVALAAVLSAATNPAILVAFLAGLPVSFGAGVLFGTGLAMLSCASVG
jgi:hypothetical protein